MLLLLTCSWPGVTRETLGRPKSGSDPLAVRCHEFRDRVVRQPRTCRYPPWIRSSSVSNFPWRSLGLNPLFLFSGNQAEAIHYNVQAEYITFIHSCPPCTTLDARIDGYTSASKGY